MILTYKLPHYSDFSSELEKATKVAQYAIQNRDKLSTKYVKHLGLKAAISNQILRKYGNNKNCKKISNIKLVINGYFIKVVGNNIEIPCLKLKIPNQIPVIFNKINQVEIDNKYCYFSVDVQEQPKQDSKDNWIGIDLNSTKHIAVLAYPKTGKVKKFGKNVPHIKKQYKNLRKKLQKKGLHKVVKKIGNKEKRITKDINHKISKAIVVEAKENNCGIRLENLKGIRRRITGHNKELNHTNNTWSFYQLKQMIEYKANLHGVVVEHIDPAYTSRACSRCGHVHPSVDKMWFKCAVCRHSDSRDGNAAFNIGKGGISKTIINLVGKEPKLESIIEYAQVATLNRSTKCNEQSLCETQTPASIQKTTNHPLIRESHVV